MLLIQINKNKSPPAFSHGDISVSLEYTTPVGQIVVDVNATDPDKVCIWWLLNNYYFFILSSTFRLEYNCGPLMMTKTYTSIARQRVYLLDTDNTTSGSGAKWMTFNHIEICCANK